MQILSEKPNYTVGTAQSLKTRELVKQQVWTMEDTYDDIIDEDLLLDESDRLELGNPTEDDCEVGSQGTRTPCKNCSCGRSSLSEEDLNNPKSSCGNVRKFFYLKIIIFH